MGYGNTQPSNGHPDDRAVARLLSRTTPHGFNEILLFLVGERMQGNPKDERTMLAIINMAHACHLDWLGVRNRLKLQKRSAEA